MIDQLAGFNEDRFFVAGTPSMIVDKIERELHIDGINLRQYHSVDTARDFI